MTLIEASHCLAGSLHPVDAHAQFCALTNVLLIDGRKDVKLATLMPCIHVTCSASAGTCVELCKTSKSFYSCICTNILVLMTDYFIYLQMRINSNGCGQTDRQFTVPNGD